MTLERRLSPEEEELQAKQAELDALLNQLAQKELDLETLHAEINTFFLAYNAALLAIQILALHDEAIANKLHELREQQTQTILASPTPGIINS